MGTLSPDDHSWVDEAMKTAHVEELAERDFMQISDGQRQRVMLARAIAQDPRVLVLDEPTSYLDIRYQIDLLRILRHLAKSRNVAVIMSIHELELAQKSADKVICVKDGQVFRAGAPEDASENIAQLLTRREFEVLRCVASSLSNREIARHLSITDGTVKVHVKHVLKKLKFRSRVEAAVWASNHGYRLDQETLEEIRALPA